MPALAEVYLLEVSYTDEHGPQVDTLGVFASMMGAAAWAKTVETWASVAPGIHKGSDKKDQVYWIVKTKVSP